MQRIWVVAAAALAGVTLASGSAVAEDTIAISEPTTLALLAAGVGVLAIARFRRQK
jgi:hypothetical protein